MTLDGKLAILEIIFFLISLVFIFLGINLSVKAVKSKNQFSERKIKKIYIRSAKKSCVIIFIGLLFYSIMNICRNYIPMKNEGNDIIFIISQSFFEMLLNFGFLIIIPYILYRWKFFRNQG